MRLLAIISAFIALALAVAACSSDKGKGNSSTAAPAASPTAASFVDLATRAATPQLFVKVAHDSSGKEILVDANGLTLYVLHGDQALAGTYTCTADCLTLWPPLVVPLFTYIQQPGGLPAQVGTFKRDDLPTDQRQLTYKAQPLYRYSQDKAPGDEKGQAESGWSIAVP